ncbi:DUF4843 domain-containing protein [Filimonas effusa]|uniref:DUF4843 domain-containing protein n=1 Tax=Filimonas effusa TaxID=2508721 RepID=A0A4Q1DBT2_9BACT|nr:DUF4843 domain-containing protein [Filimonas effusa]RXK86902.1 DUF4843 domain-containing protein [Filimonas effusa]
MITLFKNLLILLCVITTAGCTKTNLDAGYQGKPAVGLAGTLIPNAAGDSAVISFGVIPAAKLDSALKVAVRITGDIAPGDRTFTLVKVDSATTATPDEYVLPATFVVPAGQIETSFPLIIKRSARLKSTSVRLTLSVKEDVNFVRGPVHGRFSPDFKVIWNDRLVKPASWSSVFGTYSDKKFQIIIDQTGYTDFANLHTSILYNILVVVQQYVYNYNNAHPDNKLRDENGALVSFP